MVRGIYGTHSSPFPEHGRSLIRVSEAPRRELNVLGLPSRRLQPSDTPCRSFSQVARLENPRSVQVKSRFMLKLETNTFTRFSRGTCASADEGSSVIAKVASTAAGTAADRHPNA